MLNPKNPHKVAGWVWRHTLTIPELRWADPWASPASRSLFGECQAGKRPISASVEQYPRVAPGSTHTHKPHVHRCTHKCLHDRTQIHSQVSP